MNKKILGKERGITIIALVVTIIVLLILAGISIAAITGNNGIINKSDEAKIETEIATYKEQLEVIKHGEYADGYTLSVDEFLDKYAKAIQEDKMFEEAREVRADHENKVVIVVTKEGYRFEVTIEDTTYVGSEEGGGNTGVDISKVKITITSTPENWTRDKVKVKITSNVTKVSKEYSVDGGKSWNKYESEIEVQDNGTEIQARGVNEKNEKTESSKEKNRKYR
ncbi:MAG: type II secretion system protein [Clostridia bacterium]